MVEPPPACGRDQQEVRAKGPLALELRNGSQAIVRVKAGVLAVPVPRKVPGLAAVEIEKVVVTATDNEDRRITRHVFEDELAKSRDYVPVLRIPTRSERVPFGRIRVVEFRL